MTGAHTQFTSWDLEGAVTTYNEEWMEPSAAGIQAVFHNRNVTDPVMIGLKDEEVCPPIHIITYNENPIEQVFYYSTVADVFAPKRRSVKHSESKEKLPAGVTAAFALPNQIIYLFKDGLYCERELYYNGKPAFVCVIP